MNKKVARELNPVPVSLSKMQNIPNRAKDRKREVEIVSRQFFLLRKRTTDKPGITNKNGMKIDTSM